MSIAVKDIILDIRDNLQDFEKENLLFRNEEVFLWLENLGDIYIDILKPEILYETIKKYLITTQLGVTEYSKPSNCTKIVDVFYEKKCTLINFWDVKYDIGYLSRMYQYYIASDKIGLVVPITIEANKTITIMGFDKTTVTDINSSLPFDVKLRPLFVLHTTLSIIERKRLDHLFYTKWYKDYESLLGLYLKPDLRKAEIMQQLITSKGSQNV